MFSSKIKLLTMALFASLLTVSLTACGGDSSTSVSDVEVNGSSSGSKKKDSSSSAKSRLSSSSNSKSSSGSKSSSDSGSNSKSSSSQKSSSSVSGSNRVESSSANMILPCRDDKIDTCIYGSLTDERDGQTYKTVVIGKQVWMAQNLNYETADELSYCFYKDNCREKGRIYEWAAAMDSLKTGHGGTDESYPTKTPVQGACPAGWHIPSESEWETLFKGIGPYVGVQLRVPDIWDHSFKDEDSSNGKNAYGFSAYPTGYLYHGEVMYSTSQTCFWSISSEESSGIHYTYKLNGGEKAYTSHLYSAPPSTDHVGHSIRCIRDEEYNGGPLESDPPSVSTAAPHPIDYYLKSGKSYGELVDERDGHVYKTIEINGQTWMAQNLNYKIPDMNTSCIDDDEGMCDIYGRLYSWPAAIDSVRKDISIRWDYENDTIQGACPAGWHIPNISEWVTLLLPLSSDTVGTYPDFGFIGAAPKIMSEKLWYLKDSLTNETGFSAIPTMGRQSTSLISSDGYYDTWGKSFHFALNLEYTYAEIKKDYFQKPGFLRCVKDGSAIRFKPPEITEP